MGQARTERKRAEKAANREAKLAKKEAHVVEDKKRRLGNGWLALMIFGVVALMFAFVWGYNYFSKAASIETYKATTPWSQFGSIVALTQEEIDEHTDVPEIKVAVSRYYISTNGTRSLTPKEGVNIVVTEYEDGSTVITKELR